VNGFSGATGCATGVGTGGGGTGMGATVQDAIKANKTRIAESV
jgi:hypothetical protein